MKNYWYSEGFIYKGKETICKLYGTDSEKNNTGKNIIEILNNRQTNNILYFGLGLICSAALFFIAYFL